MAKYSIEVSATAEKQIRKLKQKDQIEVLRRIQELERDPKPRQSRKLQGHDDVYRVRVGNYRILYNVEGTRLTIIILKVGHRRDVYR